MTIGKFIQAGATPPGIANDGFGEFVTVERLEQLERANVRKRMDNAKPEMFADGIRIVRAKLDADAAMEEFLKLVHASVGADGVRAAIAMVTDEATKQAAADAKRALAEVGKAQATRK